MADIVERVVVLEEDFSQLPVGVIAGDYSPSGEYHVVAKLADSGRWRETVLHHSYARISHGNWQVVLETDGKHVLEQTIAPEQWQPMLAAGEPIWRDVCVEARLRPFTDEGWRAIVFRYRHGRRLCALTFENGVASVIRRDNDVDTRLGSADFTLDPDAYTSVRIECSGAAIHVDLNGKPAIACADESADAFSRGCFAFAASDVTRFRDLRVTAPRAAADEALHEQQREQDAERSLRTRHPRAVLWKKIKTPEFGTDRNLRVGDIDGDGEAEIVLARRTERLGGDNYPSITSLAAYKLSGERVWTYGEPGRFANPVTADMCFQLHDIDGDGKAEVFFCRDFELCIAGGESGKIRQRMTLPRPVLKDRWPRDIYRIMGDSIFFCDLTGSGRNDSLIVKDRYKNAWAYDRNLKELWQFSGNLGHFPFARDIDGDGKDEIAIGYHLLDHDGREKWAVNFKEHADNIARSLTSTTAQTKMLRQRGVACSSRGATRDSSSWSWKAARAHALSGIGHARKDSPGVPAI